MRLELIRVKNFRSFWSDGAEPSAEVRLAPGVNYFAGPNNAGKSNLFRALALALSPGESDFDTERDTPSKKVWAMPTITLEFALGPSANKPGPVKTLAQNADAYERSVPKFKGETHASHGKLVFHVQYDAHGTRTELLLANGKGAIKGDDKLLRKALDQFRRTVRFVDIRSGEDLTSLLQRGFTEVLGNVLKEQFEDPMKRAEAARLQYVDALRAVLDPLAKHVDERLSRFVSDVRTIELVPHVPNLQDAITRAEVRVTDAVSTGLAQKGTGVRGAILLMVLSFIAEASRRAVIFAIEEPESFLHPATHRTLGEGLEAFVARGDISMLVTTHSPFIFGSDGKGKVFSVSKTAEGKTRIEHSSDGVAAATSVAAARQALLGSRMIADMVRRAEAVPAGAALVLFVEGWTDRRYIELAAEVLHTPLVGAHVAHCEGAESAALEAFILRQTVQRERAILVLLDEDSSGVQARDLLTGKFKFQGRKEVVTYGHFVAPENVDVEAEDLFGQALLNFLDEVGRDGIVVESKQRPKSKLWHVGLNEDGKVRFVAWLERRKNPADFAGLKKVIELILDRVPARTALSPAVTGAAVPEPQATTPRP